MIHGDAELGQQRRLHVAHRLLRRHPVVGQHVDLLDAAVRIGDDPRRDHAGQPVQQLLGPL